MALRALVFANAPPTLLALAVLLAAPPAARAQVSIAPGGSVEFVAPDACTHDTIVPLLIDALGGASSSCDLANRRVEAQVKPIGSPLWVGFQTVRAFATLTNDFQVSAEPGTEGNTVGAWVSYDVDWAGRILLIGILSKPSVEMSIQLIDVDANQVIKGEIIWARDDDAVSFSIPYVPIVSLNVGGGRDAASVSNTFPAVLERGRRYRIALRIECDVFSDGGLDVGTECDYLDTFPIGNEGGGLGWSRLAVKVGLDEAVVLEGLENIAELREELDQLREDFDAHGHAYLTGRGEGHNNAEAQTGGPWFDSDGGPSIPPVDDEDGDGVPSASDACLGTAAGLAVDASGCSQAQFCAAATHPRDCADADWNHDDRSPRDCSWRRKVCEVR